MTKLQRQLLKSVKKLGLKTVGGSLRRVVGCADTKLSKHDIQRGRELTDFLNNLDDFESKSAKSKAWIGPKPPCASNDGGERRRE